MLNSWPLHGALQHRVRHSRTFDKEGAACSRCVSTGRRLAARADRYLRRCELVHASREDHTQVDCMNLASTKREQQQKDQGHGGEGSHVGVPRRVGGSTPLLVQHPILERSGSDRGWESWRIHCGSVQWQCRQQKIALGLPRPGMKRGQFALDPDLRHWIKVTQIATRVRRVDTQVRSRCHTLLSS